MIRSVLAIIFFLYFQTYSASNLDSIITSLSTLNDSNQVDSMIRLARIDVMNSNGENCIQKARWALYKAKKKGLINSIPKARFYIAAGFDDIQKLDSSIYHYEQALKEMEGTSSEGWKVHVYINTISILRDLGRYDNAVEFGLEAIRVFEKERDTARLAQLYTSLGYVYDRMREYRTAIPWHRKSLAFYRYLGDDYNEHFVIGRIGIAYDDLGIFDSAHYYNQKGLNYSIAIKDSFEIGNHSSNIGNTYIKQKKWKLALHYLEAACEMLKLHGDYGNRAISAINLGNAYTHTGAYKKAKESIYIGLENAILWNDKKFQSEAYYRLHELYERQQMLDSTLYYFKKYKQVEDSLYGIQKAKQVAELNAKYDTEKKEQQIEIQDLQLQEQKVTLEARKRLIIILVLLAFAILGVVYFLYQRYKTKKEAELQRAIIQEQEKGLEAIFYAQEEERKRISKDLHDGVGQQLSGLKMAFQKLGTIIQIKLPEEEKAVEELAQIVSESADEVRSISHQMMPRALVELGLIPALEDMLTKSLKMAEIEYEFEHYGIERRLSEQKEVSLYRICQELINNIIKHSGATHVNIQLFKNRAKLILIVEDNGSGISGQSASGHGLLNIKSRLNTLNGEVNFEPSPQSGTLATIRIPI